MKRFITIAALLLGCAVCGAQDSVEALQEKYNRLVRTLGYDGVGVETTLERWEAVSPLDGNMLEGWFNFWITKARSTEALPLDRQTYLGQKPLVSLKDSTGRIVNYFQVTNYDDEYFGKAASAIERAIAAHPDNLGYRLERIDALMAYEEGTPELALDALLKLIQEDQKGTVRWIYGGDTLQRSDFADLMQQYCYFLFQADEPGTLDAFYTISQKLFKSYPDKLDFLCNQGSYFLKAKGNYKKALKLFEDVLKKDPENRNALTNSVIAARKMGKKELAGKYHIRLAKLNEGK